MNRSTELSTQSIVDFGIKSDYEEDAILRSLDIRDPKLEAIVRAYIHVRRENVMESKNPKGMRSWWCCG